MPNPKQFRKAQEKGKSDTTAVAHRYRLTREEQSIPRNTPAALLPDTTRYKIAHNNTVATPTLNARNRERQAEGKAPLKDQPARWGRGIVYRKK